MSSIQQPRTRAQDIHGVLDAADLCERAGDYHKAESAYLRALSDIRRSLRENGSSPVSEEEVQQRLKNAQASKGGSR